MLRRTGPLRPSRTEIPRRGSVVGPFRGRRSRAPRLLGLGVLTLAVTTGLVSAPVVSGAEEASVSQPMDQRTTYSSTDVFGSSATGGPEVPEGAGTPQALAPAVSAPAPVPPATAPPSPSVPSASASQPPRPVASNAECSAAGRTTQQPVRAGSVLSTSWKQSRTADDVTFDLTGVLSTAFPSSEHPFVTGTTVAGARTCILGGELRGTIDPGLSWENFHDDYNAACVKVVALDWLQIHGTRCDGVEDGFRPQEGGVNLNRTSFLISGTHLSNVADDCLENDYTLGGVVRDSLWESCFTGISERPSSANGKWTSPEGETLTLDHVLIGLHPMPHDSDKGTGTNALFKWSTSANDLVIKCSTFFVPERSVNGTDTMAVPAGTVVDDSACPNRPSTIVWLGGGEYPAPTAGLRVVDDRKVWDDAVAAWKAAHN